MSRSRDDENHGSGDGTRAVVVMPTSNSPASPKSWNEQQKKHQNAFYTPKEKSKTTNAFDMMMSGGKTSSSKKRKRSFITGSNNNQTTTSKFVPCPAGCGKHILPHEMNKHLDACLLRQAMKHKQKTLQKESPPSLVSNNSQPEELEQNEGFSSSVALTGIEETPPESFTICSTSPPEDLVKDVDRIVANNERDQQNPSTSAASKKNTANSDQKQNNAFAHMMKNSAKVFSEQEASSTSLPKLFERMHLHKDGRVSLMCYSNNRILPLEETISWSATIQVRGKKEGATTPPIDLLVSSSVPSSVSLSSTPNELQRPRLVQKHSRLSVPVLKSILQKGIRRRKPLPSVRVASELADKSLGDLLRRLPIIILEDSTLHPSLPFLVWLMMAVSKDYQPPLLLLKKVLGIVFEMASCRWQDSLPTNNSKAFDTKELQQETLTLASLHKTAIKNTQNEGDDQPKQNQKDVVLNGDELIVWSMLMRGQYGGMACDIQMLQGYAQLWHGRYNSIQSIPYNLKKRLSPNIPVSSTLHSTTSSSSAAIGSISAHKASGEDQSLRKWNQIPGFIHKSAAKHSTSRIDRLLPSIENNKNPYIRAESHSFIGLPSLTRIDLTPEGVDFHCSSVLESAILCDTSILKECFVKLANGRPRLRTAGQDRRAWLEGLLKSCMWKFSGGVNFRLPLTAAESIKDGDDDDDLKDFYESLIRPRVDAFSQRYIDERLNNKR